MIANLVRALLATAAAGLNGCGPGTEVWHGPPQHDTQAIELDKTEMTRVEIGMGAG